MCGIGRTRLVVIVVVQQDRFGDGIGPRRGRCRDSAIIGLAPYGARRWRQSTTQINNTSDTHFIPPLLHVLDRATYISISQLNDHADSGTIPTYKTPAEVKQRSLSHPQPKAEPREAQQGRSKTSARQASGTCIEGASSSVCCVSKADNANNAWSITEESQLFQYCLVQSRYLSYILLADTDFHLSSLSLRIRST